MDNYEYIIASLPDLKKDWRFPDGENQSTIISFIQDNCSVRDNEFINDLLEGFDENKLNIEFYNKVLHSSNRFLREYFKFDLNLRNTKVEYLNRELKREIDKDIFLRIAEEFEEKEKIEEIFNQKDLLAKEKAIDDLFWAKIDELNIFNYFNLDVVLGFIAKLHIVSRWLVLDEKMGREMFKKLINEVRGTFKGVPADLANHGVK